ncbi:uncharacterized protein LOC135207785 [Macrobrachium nipponense]|uniref:uncharacterized protein LOC135207785 n=1 Tax=Macrobrachium nipponense TaxID=159736 RepID=UPI0030C7ADBD
MSKYLSNCCAFINDFLARIPLVGIGITSNLYEDLQPVASFLRRNWFAGALAGIGGLLYSHLQKERVARRRAEDDNLKSRVALDFWQNVSDNWETLFRLEEHKNMELRKDIGLRKEAEEALRKRVCDLEKCLADEKIRHLEELLDMEEAAAKQVKLPEEASNKIASENQDLKKLNEEQTLLISRQMKEIEDLKQLESGYKELKNELATFAREKEDLLRRLQEQEALLKEPPERAGHTTGEKEKLEGEVNEKSRIGEMEEELRELRHSLTLTNSDRDRLREEKERLREIIDQKETEYIELEREVKALGNVNQELIKDIYQWDRDTVAFEQTIEDLQGAIDDLMRRNVELSKLNMEMEGKNTLQEKKLQQEQEALLKEPPERAGHTTGEKEKLEGEVNGEEPIGEMEEELRELRHSLTLTNSDRDRLREEKERLREIIDQKETEYIELEREVKALGNVNQELIKDIYQWDRDTVAFEQTIEDLQGAIDDLMRRNVELSKLNMEMEGKNTLQEKKLQQEQEALLKEPSESAGHATEQKEKLEGEINEKMRIGEMQEELRKLRHSLTLTNSDRDRLRDEKERLQEIIEQKETEYIELEREVKALENVNQELIKDIYQWDRNTVAYEQTIEDLQGAIDDLMRRNVELNKLNMEMEGKNTLQEKKLQQQHQMIIDAYTSMAANQGEVIKQKRKGLWGRTR